MADSPFTPLQVNDTVWPFEPVPSTVNPANTSDSVSSRVLRVCLTDCVERGTTGVDLMEGFGACQGSIIIQFGGLTSLINPLVEH